MSRDNPLVAWFFKNLPWLLGMVVTVGAAFAVLQRDVKALTEKVDALDEVPVVIARMQVREEGFKEDIQELKMNQQKILDAVNEHNANHHTHP